MGGTYSHNFKNFWNGRQGTIGRIHMEWCFYGSDWAVENGGKFILILYNEYNQGRLLWTRLI